MQHLRFLAAVGLVLLGTPLALADDVQVGELVVSKAWTRATPKGATTAAGYLTITNKGQTPDKLMGASSPEIGKAGVHEMATVGGVMQMRPVAGGLAIDPGKSVTLQPGGYHLMFTHVTAPLKKGDKLAATLTFEKAGDAKVEFDILGIGAPSPDGGQQGGGQTMPMQKMR